MLISKIIFKNKKNIILIYLKNLYKAKYIKNIIKNNFYFISKNKVHPYKK
jgi:hypothetical protein